MIEISEFIGKMDNADYIIDNVGVPAVLEQCGEECCELAQVCLKLGRRLRGENPTPATEDVLLEEMTEEIADVLTCIDLIFETGMVSQKAVESYQLAKTKRWASRINEALGAKDEPGTEA